MYNTFIYLIITFSENWILSDPDLKDPIPLEYLSHADRYVAELRKACNLMTKLRNSAPLQDKIQKYIKNIFRRSLNNSG